MVFGGLTQRLGSNRWSERGMHQKSLFWLIFFGFNGCPPGLLGDASNRERFLRLAFRRHGAGLRQNCQPASCGQQEMAIGGAALAVEAQQGEFVG